VDHKTSQDNGAGGFSRRTFIGLMGIGALGVATGCENTTQTSPTAQPPIPPGTPGVVEPVATALLPDKDPYHLPTMPPKLVASARPIPPVHPDASGIIPRSAWAHAGPDLNRVDPMNGVHLITFHHSGDPKPFWETGFAETAQHLEYVREYHRSRNFQDIGYHFAIDRLGRVWQLRSLRYQGQHVRYNNEHNVGVVCLGNFDMQPMTEKQKEKVRSFGLLLRRQYSLPIRRVYTHQEIVSTDCPGHGMQGYMVNIRRQSLI
jgi:hypothetical protein